MSTSSVWLDAFPIKSATDAVDALRDAWTELGKKPRPQFNPSTHEAALTKRLKVYVENYTARERGLLGMWSAEDVIGEIDPVTKYLIEERRTDIVYGWNDANQGMRLVFEFKRMGKQKAHRNHYLNENGLARFVTGIYSRRQAVAAMVGVLLDPEQLVVPPIRKALEDATLGASLKLKLTAAGEPISRPSTLFSSADFDTEHERDPSLAPTHGTIRVSHFFFKFGYATSTNNSKKSKKSVQPKAVSLPVAS